MAQIELPSDFYIVTSDKGCILYQRYTASGKDGTKEARRKKGFYSDIPQAVKAFLRFNQESQTNGVHTYLQDMIHRLEESNRKAAEEIAEVIERSIK